MNSIRAFMVKVEPADLGKSGEFQLETGADWADIIGRGACGIDWGYRYLGVHKFFFVCDDMGRLKDPSKQIIGAYQNDYHPIERRYYKPGENKELWDDIEGNIIIMSAETDDEGNTLDLTDEEIALIQSHMQSVLTSGFADPDHKFIHDCITEFNYHPAEAVL